MQWDTTLQSFIPKEMNTESVLPGLQVGQLKPVLF